MAQWPSVGKPEVLEKLHGLGNVADTGKLLNLVLRSARNSAGGDYATTLCRQLEDAGHVTATWTGSHRTTCLSLVLTASGLSELHAAGHICGSHCVELPPAAVSSQDPTPPLRRNVVRRPPQPRRMGGNCADEH